MSARTRLKVCTHATYACLHIRYYRVAFLYGPPGTGKTSLCKALAQKISIRMAARFSCAQLVEINAHSLFSKVLWLRT